MSFSQYESGTTRRPLPAGGAPTKVSSTRKKKERKRKKVKSVKQLLRKALQSVCTVQCTLSLCITVHKFGRMYI